MSAAGEIDVLVDARVVERGHTGIARYVVELGRRLGEESIALASLERAGAPLASARSRVRARSPFLSPAEQLELPLLVANWRRRHPRGVFWIPSFNAAALAPGPLALTIHDANHLAFPDQYTPLHTAYYRSVVRLACARARAILVPSAFAADELAGRLGVDHRRLRVVPEGVSARPLPSREAIDAVRARLGLPERFVAYVGNFKPHKNLPMLLAAARAFAKEAEVVLVGGTAAALGRHLDEARANGVKVHLPGQLSDDDLFALLAGAAAFTFPSRYEGFGLPVLEAMSVGVPVVATSAGAVPEVAGDAALLVGPDDVDGFGEAVRSVLRNDALADSLRARGRARAAELTWERCAAATAPVLAEAAR